VINPVRNIYPETHSLGHRNAYLRFGLVLEKAGYPNRIRMRAKMQRARIIQTSTIREGLVFAKAPVFFLNRGPRKTARFIAAVTTMQARAKTQSGAAGGVKYNAKIQPASTPMLITRAFFQRRIMAGDGIPLRANYIKLR